MLSLSNYITMQPINSTYIHLIDSQLTLVTTPWYKVIDKYEADNNVNKWKDANLVTGCHLRELGAEIQNSDICKFFDITTDLKLYTNIKRYCPIYSLQAFISDC